MLCRATSLGPVRCKWRKYRPYILVGETESNKPIHKYHIVSGNKCWGEKDNQEGAYTVGWVAISDGMVREGLTKKSKTQESPHRKEGGSLQLLVLQAEERKGQRLSKSLPGMCQGQEDHTEVSMAGTGIWGWEDVRGESRSCGQKRLAVTECQ